MIKMDDFEQGLANIMGSFMEVNLDCVEKQNQEIEQLQQENKQLKEVIEEVREEFKKSLYFFEQVITEDNEMGLRKTEYKLVNSDNLLQILDKAKENK